MPEATSTDPIQPDNYPRKRRRKLLSCEACHRQKVKCDRKLPCRRCINGNRASTCRYQLGALPVRSATKQHGSTPAASIKHESPDSEGPESLLIASRDGDRPADSPFASFVKGRVRFKGWTSWSPIFYQFREVVPLFTSRKKWPALAQQVEELKSCYPRHTIRAFPLGESIGNSRLSGFDPLSNLPDKPSVQSMVEYYLETFDKAFPLFDHRELEEELHSFWQQPRNVNKVWLAQLFLILAISYHANPALYGGPPGEAGFAMTCIDAAEASLLDQGSFLFKPAALTMRLMALIALVKHMDIVTHEDSHGSGPYSGILIQTAMSQGLHLSPSLFPAMSTAEARNHQNLWATTLVLAASNAIVTGRLLPVPREYVEVLSYSLRSGSSIVDTVLYMRLLAKALPVIVAVINKMNAPYPDSTSAEHQQLDFSVRQLLSTVQESTGILATTQKLMLEVLLQRSLLSLHAAYHLSPDTCLDPEHSSRTIHQVCHSLLTLQESIYYPSQTRWFSNFCISHFSIAALYLAVSLRNGDFDDHDADFVSSRDSGKPESESAKTLAYSALHAMLKRARHNLKHSFHTLQVFFGFLTMVKVLEAIEAREPSEPAIHAASLEMVEAATLAFGKIASTQPIDTLALETADESLDAAGFPDFDDVEFLNEFNTGVNMENLFDDLFHF